MANLSICCLLFFSGAMVSCSKLIAVDFRKVPKHFLNINTNESVSTVLIKNGSILYCNHLLPRLVLFKVLVLRKGLF